MNPYFFHAKQAAQLLGFTEKFTLELMKSGAIRSWYKGTEIVTSHKSIVDFCNDMEEQRIVVPDMLIPVKTSQNLHRTTYSITAETTMNDVVKNFKSQRKNK